MTNELVKAEENALELFGGFDALVNSIAESEGAVRTEMSTVPDGSTQYANFMKYSDFAEAKEEAAVAGGILITPWSYGLEGRPIYPESVWALDYTTLEHGFIGWKRGENNKIIKGQQPDMVMAPFSRARPKAPEDLPHVDAPCVKFRAVCVHSPDDSDIGVLVEFKEYRKMASGHFEILKAVRDRFTSIDAARQAGQVAQAAEMMQALYPRVQFDFDKTRSRNYGWQNKPIYKLLGWGSRSNVEEVVKAAENEGSLDQELDTAEAPTQRRGRRRS